MKIFVPVFALMAATAVAAIPSGGKTAEDMASFEEDMHLVFVDSSEEAREAENLEKAKQQVDKENAAFAAGEAMERETLYIESLLSDEEFIAEKGGAIPLKNGKHLVERGLGLLETPEELRATYAESAAYFSEVMSSVNEPSQYDARAYGRITPVKNQGSCGSCAAFASAAALETCLQDAASTVAAGRSSASPFNIAEQQLVDCGYDPDNGRNGCNGAYLHGYPDFASKSLDSPQHENAYAYVMEDNNYQCQSSAPWNYGAKVTDSYYTYSCNADLLKKLIYKHGAVVVGVYASDPQFRNYASGIITDSCSSTSYNHAVTAVGYGTENGVDYFIAKNSWGAGWGEGGFFKMKAGICSIDTVCSVPICESVSKYDAIPPPPPPAPACDVSNTWGHVSWNPAYTYKIPLRTQNEFGDTITVYRLVKCTTDNICTPQEDGVSDACMYICGMSRC